MQDVLTLAKSVRNYQSQGSPFAGIFGSPVNYQKLSKQTSLNTDSELARQRAAGAQALQQQTEASKDVAGFSAELALSGYKAMFPYLKAFQDAELNSGTYDTAQQTGAQMGSAAINALAGTAANIAGGLFRR